MLTKLYRDLAEMKPGEIIAVCTAILGIFTWLWKRGVNPLWKRRLEALEARERLNVGIQEVIRQFQPNGGSSLWDRLKTMELTIDAIRTSQQKADLRQWCFFSSTADVGVFETGPDGQVLRVSPAFTRWTGRGADEFIGWGWKDALHPNGETQTISAWLDSVKERRRFDEMVTLQDSDGAPVCLHVEATPVMVGGQLNGYFGIGRHRQS